MQYSFAVEDPIVIQNNELQKKLWLLKQLSHISIKPVFGGLWPGKAQTSAQLQKLDSLGIMDIASLDIILSRQQTTKVRMPGMVAWSKACLLGMQAAPSSIPTSSTFFVGDLVMKTSLQPFSLFRWFKKSSCQLLVKECALSTGKLPRRLAQKQCG